MELSLMISIAGTIGFILGFAVVALILAEMFRQLIEDRK